MSLHRDPLGDADDQRDFRVDRLADRVSRAGRRDVDDGGLGARRLAGLGHRVEDRQADMLRAAFAGRNAADHLGAVGDGLFGVEGPVLLPVKPWQMTLVSELIRMDMGSSISSFVQCDAKGLTTFTSPIALRVIGGLRNRGSRSPDAARRR